MRRMVPRSGERSLRRDAAVNRQRVLVAAGEVLRSDPAGASMSRIAERAGVGTATAYRYFPTLDALLSTYLHDVVIQLRDFSHDCPERGPQLFDAVATRWLWLVEQYGPAMVHLRSRRGLLERLRAQDPIIVAVRDAWERPIRFMMRAHGVREEYFENALMFYNALFDPREVLDLRRVGYEPEEIRVRLTASFVAALRAWADVR